jgi:hypothetical protein
MKELSLENNFRSFLWKIFHIHVEFKPSVFVAAVPDENKSIPN